MTVSAKLFRDAMAHWANTVAVVATSGEAGPRGLTVTSYASLTDSPASVLICVSQNSSTLPHILANGVFSLNLLGAEQENLANIFAGRTDAKGAERFEGLELEHGILGQPQFKQAMVSFECAITGESLHSTHRIITGEVKSVLRGSAKAPLLYWERAYQTLAL